MQVWVYTFISLTVCSLISLVGAFTLSLKPESIKKLIVYMVSFAVGALFGDAFIHILPESFTKLGVNVTTSLLILCGIFLFFVLEKFLRWHHCHLPDDHDHIHPMATLNLVGDALHNMMDGMIIAASFQISVPIGIATSLAVILHEIPQEIGDFGILVHSGMPVKKALFFNLVSSFAAFLGAAIILCLGAYSKNLSLYLMPITAGGFLYVAGSDLIPELHRHEVKISNAVIQLVCILLGVGVMYLLTFIE
jgi:zinc and cadmium transporter